MTKKPRQMNRGRPGGLLRTVCIKNCSDLVRMNSSPTLACRADPIAGHVLVDRLGRPSIQLLVHDHGGQGETDIPRLCSEPSTKRSR